VWGGIQESVSGCARHGYSGFPDEFGLQYTTKRKFTIIISYTIHIHTTHYTTHTFTCLDLEILEHFLYIYIYTYIYI